MYKHMDGRSRAQRWCIALGAALGVSCGKRTSDNIWCRQPARRSRGPLARDTRPHPPNPSSEYNRSCDEGGSGRRVVLEGWGDLLLRLVVARETVDTRLDENEAELRVLVLAVDLEVLAHGDRLFDEVPQILGDLGGKACPCL